MTGTSTTTSAWMLLLMLLGLFIFPSHVHMLRLPREINVEMEALEMCSKESNKPQQLNIFVPQPECPFPYFIAGIESLNCSNEFVKNLLYRLKMFNNTCPIQNRNCILNVTDKPLIPTQDFQRDLKNLTEKYNADNCFTS